MEGDRKMTVLVLGGAGYIGSHTVYALIEKGEDVVIIDNLETGHIEAVHPKARFYKGDIRDRAFVDSVLDKEKNRCGNSLCSQLTCRREHDQSAQVL